MRSLSIHLHACCSSNPRASVKYTELNHRDTETKNDLNHRDTEAQRNGGLNRYSLCSMQIHRHIRYLLILNLVVSVPLCLCGSYISSSLCGCPLGGASVVSSRSRVVA